MKGRNIRTELSSLFYIMLEQTHYMTTYDKYLRVELFYAAMTRV